MAGAGDHQAIFVACARNIAFLRCLPDAERRQSGVVLALNCSQFARDGLAAAARSFAQIAAQKGAMPAADVTTLALSVAMHAPLDVWWRPSLAIAEPSDLDRGDASMSLDEILRTSREITAQHACASESTVP